MTSANMDVVDAGACPARPGALPVVPPKAHFAFVQGLRGIAAFWVVLFHVTTIGAVAAWVGPYRAAPWMMPLRDGRGGVAVFFVLSGFVIAHSLWGKPMARRDLSTFIVRRSIRLDPPYWAAMALMVAIRAVQGLRHGYAPDVPDVATVVAHVFYVQELLRLPEIQIVFWTLTYEIQFYLIAAIGCCLFHYATRRWPAARTLIARSLLWPMIALAFVSVVVPREWWLHGLFTTYWYAFAAGALAYAAGQRRWSAWPVVTLSALMLAHAPWTTEVFASPAALTALLLLGVSRARKQGSWLRGVGWQWLGNTSYSLYLVHMPVLLLAISMLDRSLPVWLLLPAYLVICVMAADVFWRVIERPAHRLAQRFSRRSAGA